MEKATLDLEPLDAMEKVLSSGDMVIEIAVHIPPSDPAHLVRFALVCKTWFGVLTSQEFLQAYAKRYGRPPLLGYFLSCPSSSPVSEVDRFVPSAARFPSFSPNISTDSWYALDVRQGRVLLLRSLPDLIVWLPMSGEHFLLPEPPRSFQYQAGAVICAESPQCSDPDCCSEHGFSVIFVGCDDKLVSFQKKTFFEGNETWASIYSQETDEWGETYVLKDNRYTDHPLLEQHPPVLHKDALYFTLEMHELQGEEVRAALKFDITDKKLSLVLAPDDAHPDFGIFLGTSEGVAFAGIADDESEGEEGDAQNTISIWTLDDSDPTVWSPTADIDLGVILPAGAIQAAKIPSPVGFIDGEATICIDSGGRIYTVEIDSLKTSDIGPSAHSLAVLPFLQFCMPLLPKPEDEDSESEAEIALKKSNQKSEGDAIDSSEDEGANAIDSSDDEGVNAPEDKKNTKSKAEVIGKRRGIQVETPPGKKAKAEQHDQSDKFSATESSSGEDSEQDSW